MSQVRNSKCKATVVLVAYQNNKTFRKILQKILRADYDNYEIIVVDNNRLPHLKDCCKPARYFHNRNNGKLAGATNLAARQARCEYIVYVCTNHTIIYSNDWLKYMIEYMEEMREKKNYVLGGDLRPEIRQRRVHVQGGVFIGLRSWMLKNPYNQRKYPFTLMDVDISRKVARSGAYMLRIPRIFSAMNGWKKRNHRDNIIKKKYKIVHSHENTGYMAGNN